VKYNYIAVEGPIGVGKTSLTRLMAEYVQEEVRLIHEDNNNPFLNEYYNDRAGSAFRTQLYFLLSRFNQLKDLRQLDLFRQSVISDFIFEKDKIFAYLTLNDSELLLYDKLYDLLSPQIARPDLVIYLTAEIKNLKKRIVQRGRDFEKDIDPEYLEEVCKAYNYYFYHYSATPLLIVNTDEIDYVNNPDDLEDLMHQVDTIERGTQYYTPRR
jgi:deoxyguanosine kinase